MRAYIVTVLFPNEFPQDKILEALNRGIKLVADENKLDVMHAITWNTHIIDKFNLERQDI